MRTVIAALVLAAAVGAPAGGQQQPFPHDRHARLFPMCETCHAGIATADAATAMPPESSCRECHNGRDVAIVTWRRADRGVGLLRFSHRDHARDVDSTGRACATCHGASGGRSMDVRRADPPSCLACHTHRATAHLADDNRCATCHVPLTAATGLSDDRVRGLPKPPSHEARDYAVTHAPGSPVAAASCATCHARESCARCHVNASTQPLITALARDARVARLVAGRPAVYPRPADHRGEVFAIAHGASARREPDRCAACHARASCTTCHLGSGGGGADAIARMPVAEPGGAPGVQLRLQVDRPRASAPLAAVARGDSARTAPRPVRVHETGFAANHGPRAAAGALTCEGCHGKSFCSDCHAGEGSRRFHPANFTQRHAADSYGRENDCASCHNAELFCRSCHRESGLATKGRLDVAFHNAQPQWLLQHGRAARQGLQSCTTCHVQKDCLTCHGTTGWGVSPHGAGFRAGRLADRNATQCLMCHLKVPGRTGR